MIRGDYTPYSGMLEFPGQELDLSVPDGDATGLPIGPGQSLEGAQRKRNPPTENVFPNLKYLWRAAVLCSIL